MPEQKLSFKEQKALKLKIEDEIPKFLDGEMKQSALDFIAYMRANKMQPAWLSTNSWKANYKGQNICDHTHHCGPGWGMTFLGSEYENVCHNVPVRYVNPGEAEINCIKRILELMRRTVGENK